MPHSIVIRGARQHNLQGIDLDLPTHELIVVTGVSGSGKSSLVFDTLYAEGQRRYVETFSPYARQFLDRMDRPQVDRMEGVPPAIAIDQTNPVRTSRSTVGTMTELNDHLKLLFSRAAQLYCRGCATPVRRDTPQTIFDTVSARVADAQPRVVITFPVRVPHNFSEAEVLQALEQQGYTRVFSRTTSNAAGDSAQQVDLQQHVTEKKRPAGRSRKKPAALHDGARVALEILQDRLRWNVENRDRIIEALEAAMRVGRGCVSVHVTHEQDDARTATPSQVQDRDDASASPSASQSSAVAWRFSADLHCADCDIHYQTPTPSLFSFNSPLGACETCRGFGRTIGVDFGLVVPDQNKSLREGAVRPWQTESYRECQDDLQRFARKRGVPLDTPWREMSDAQRAWVLEGEGDWEDKCWYGVRRFFAWLETKAYKMHIRVLLSKYRAFTLCPACHGARLKPDALLWRLGSLEEANRLLEHGQRVRPPRVHWNDASLASLPGVNLHELMLAPIVRTHRFFHTLTLPAPLDEASDLVLQEVRARLTYLLDVGLSYLTLDRQSRTLSGGEVQRINLTTALGASLVNTLFVLDEPSIGLHPRDIQRVIGVMRRLRDAGNSLVVVEHDPQVMQAADRLLDIGPGPGERGGRVLFFDTPDKLQNARDSLTADYLLGRKQVAPRQSISAAASPSAACSLQPAIDAAASIVLRGARQHNLKGVDVEIPLQQLVCVTGVSGSGKSTLVHDVLYPALRKHFGKPSESPGAFDSLSGAEHLKDVVMVDQTPIGRTTRSNPASYVGAFDPIRQLFARTPLARERGYTHGAFSFNAGAGRCPTCCGSGFEHVEMQFLSDVYLRCADCDGRRYRAELLEVTLTLADGRDYSIADVLDMTVAQAVAGFAGQASVLGRLQPLLDVGLDYLKLGQPVPTLSGGEAQRLKLAGHLADSAESLRATQGERGALFLFDEPTTGLHFDDIGKLLRAFRRLVAAGHSLLVIEHNIDVIAAADWLIDLGPEGGDGGGEVICVGAPQQVMQCASSHTGAALRQASQPFNWNERAPTDRGSNTPRPPLPEGIQIRGAREHNLKNIDVTLPRDQLAVVTGVSGSGKSTLAFDIVFGEGQRRYLESLNAYARQFVQPASRPDVDAIFGIPPTVAIEQRTSRGGRKSTVATLTEIYHFLRLLFVKLGVQYCPDCRCAIEPQSTESIAARLRKDFRGQRLTVLAPLVINRKGYYTELATWAARKGFDALRVDGEMTSTQAWPRLSRFKEHTIEAPVATLEISAKSDDELLAALKTALELGKGVMHVLVEAGKNVKERAVSARALSPPHAAQVFSTRRACPCCARSFPELDPRLFSFNSKHGWCEACFGAGVLLQGFDAEQSGEEISWNEWCGEDAIACSACNGQRLNPAALNVRFEKHSIAALTARSVRELQAFFAALKLSGRAREIARDILPEVEARLGFLADVGLGYLTLDRAAPTLSGGEAQRIRLAAQLGSNLQGVCYILDEPTIGLHPRDNQMLLETLERLVRKGNSLLVVEHDEETIRRADYVLDLGPGAGALGGRVVAQGSATDLQQSPHSVTGRYLAAPLQHPLAQPRAVSSRSAALVVCGTNLHNLRKQNVRIPLGRLVVITGVSGSGKSTLARDVLHDNLCAALNRRRGAKLRWRGCKEIRGWEQITRVLEVDQTPIGKTPRSCPATYVGFWDDIRRVFATTPDARMRGFDASRFSFNTAGGRCAVCEGQGIRKIEMNFLPDVRVTCEACGGMRFNADTLAIQYRGRSIGDVLTMSIDEAASFFDAHARLHRSLRLLQDVGLGYLTLGQQSPTLSGGEAQRIKLVTELARAAGPVGERDARSTLYVLDEPTVGLHMADVAKLIHVLHRLVDIGSSVVVVEHDLDIIAEADWIIDLGPEAGEEGGRVIAQGSAQELVNETACSQTAAFLAQHLKRSTAAPMHTSGHRSAQQR